MVALHSVGLDVHARRSSVCILDGCGKTVKQMEVRGGWPLLLERISQEVPRPFAVCFEASCGYAGTCTRSCRRWPSPWRWPTRGSCG